MKKSIFYLLLFIFGNVAYTQNTGNVPLDGRVIVGKLSNGLTYYILPNKKPENKVELRLVVNAGSVLEEDNQQGLAHFCEHMAFNGTKNFKKNQLVDYLQSAGVKFGAHINAYTSFDETVYMLSLPTESKEVVNKGFQILEDWAHNLLFDPVEVEKERGVVLEEYRIGLGAQKRMMGEYLPKLLYQSKYAERLPIGKKDVLENFKVETITSFYKNWYRPDLMAVIVVGDIDKATAEAKIKAHFGHLKNPTNAPIRPVIQVPDHTETFVKTVTDEEATRGTIQMTFKIPGEYKLSSTVKEFQQSLEQTIFYSMINDRLWELSKKPESGFTTAWLYQDELWVRSKEAIQAFAVVGGGKYLDALKNLSIEIERIQRYGFSESELNRAKENIKTMLEKAIKEKDKTESTTFTYQLINHFLTNATMADPEWEFNAYEKYVSQITTEKLKQLSSTLDQTENRVIVMTGPSSDKELMPSEASILSTIASVKQLQIDAKTEIELPESFMDAKPLSGKIASKSYIKHQNMSTLVLSNGVKVIYKPTKLKNDEMLFYAISLGGTNLLEDDDFQHVINGLGVISQTGVSTFSDSDIDKMLSGKSVRVSPFVGSTSEGMSGSCRPQDAETLMELVHLYFTNPRMDEEAFRGYINRQQSFYNNATANPNTYFSVEFGRWLNDNHARSFKIPTAEEWEKTDYNKIFEVYKERFANPADFTFVFVGNIDTAILNQLVVNYLGSLKTSNAKESTRDIGQDIRKGSDRLEVKKGSEPKSMVRILIGGELEYDKKTDLIFDIAAEVLTIKMVEVLREEMGGVYGTSASSSFSRQPKSTFAFNIGFPCGPENVDTLISAALAELKKLADNGPNAKDLEKVQQTMIKTLNSSVQSNQFWLRSLINYSIYNEVPASLEEMEKQIRSITAKEVQMMVQKYLQKDFLIGVLYPE